jgi:hypothetical protein
MAVPKIAIALACGGSLDAIQVGFISAGGGSWQSDTLNRVPAGGIVWVKGPGFGFVGVGEVTVPRQSMTDFLIHTDEEELFGNQNTV